MILIAIFKLNFNLWDFIYLSTYIFKIWYFIMCITWQTSCIPTVRIVWLIVGIYRYYLKYKFCSTAIIFETIANKRTIICRYFTALLYTLIILWISHLKIRLFCVFMIATIIYFSIKTPTMFNICGWIRSKKVIFDRSNKHYDDVQKTRKHSI